jgi:UDP-N-acetylmuramyl pentapeptide phosphotransferase/UDP-N-acetylglucosamine-1-phosphate transferase
MIAIKFILLPSLFAFILSIITIPFVIKWVNNKGFLAEPNERTSHLIPKPSMGGIGIFVGITSCIPFLNFNIEIFILWVSILLMFIGGFWDDLKDLKSSSKFLMQIICAVALFCAGFSIDNLHGIFGIFELNPFLSFIISILLIVGVTNSFNLIDGIDGLAGGISFISAFFFGLIFIMNNQINYSIIAFSVCGSLIGFLRYNFYPAKIFMGDTGSLFLGLLMSVFMIKTFQTNGTSEVSISGSIVLIFLPVFDTVRLFAYRIFKGNSPFLADKNHLHHLVLRLFPKHSHATLLILLIHSGLLGFIFITNYLDYKEFLTVLLMFLVIISSLFLVTILLIVANRKLKKLKDNMKEINSKNQQLENTE